jgi:SAM-dependent methyltransferase
MKVSVLARAICPPILWKGLARAKARLSGWLAARSGQDPMQQPVEGKQDLNVYWQPEVAKILERWGEGTAWTEIEFLLVNCRGRVLDIACGPGNNIEMLSRFSALEVHGCDISDYLIGRAIKRGIPKDRLRVCDATQMDYPDQTFDYAYSIGSLEHFTESGIAALISEAHRVTRSNTFHMLPVSRSGKDEGWLKTVQSFYNNSTDWWLEKFRATYADVYVLDSKWEDKLSVGKWFVCLKERPA